MVAVDLDTTFVALGDITRIIFEAFEAADLAFVDLDIVAVESDQAVASEFAFGDVATCDLSDFGDSKDAADLGLSDGFFLDGGSELFFHRGFDIVEQVVDHAVDTDLDAFVLCEFLCFCVGSDLEADDHGVGGGRQVDIVFGDTTDRSEGDREFDLDVLDLEQAFAQGFEGALHIGFEDDVEFFFLFAKKIAKGSASNGTSLFDASGLFLAVFCDLFGGFFVSHAIEGFAGIGEAGESENADGHGRAGFFERAVAVVKHRTDATVVWADNHGIAAAQGSFLDEESGDGAASFFNAGLDDGSFGAFVWVGAKFEDLGFEQDALKEIVDTCTCHRAHFGHLDTTTKGFIQEIVLSEFVANAFGIGAWFVDLVDCDDDGDARRLGVSDGFDRLWHDPVVGSDHEDDDIGDLCATRSHCGKRLVSGRIEEDDLVSVAFYGIGPDVLGDPACFLIDDASLADAIKQRGFSVVDVSHDGDDRGAVEKFVGAIGFFALVQDSFFFEADVLDVVVEVFCEASCFFDGQGLVDGGHESLFEEFHDQFSCFDAHAMGQFAHGDRFIDFDHALSFGHGRGDGLLWASLFDEFAVFSLFGLEKLRRGGTIFGRSFSATKLVVCRTAVGRAAVVTFALFARTAKIFAKAKGIRRDRIEDGDLWGARSSGISIIPLLWAITLAL